MKKHIILALLFVVSLTTATAQEMFSFLNFVDSTNVIKQVNAEGLVIKFVDGNAVATTGNDTITIALSNLSHMEFTNVQQADESHPKGDVDGNDVVDIDDLNILINIILKKDSASNYEGRAYVTGQDTVDIDDLNAVVNIMLHKDE